jgi:D-beta-D-heptose 7-phosphate kinase/D-beta-D-heptose 1-phosphate adenosyltransferase
LIVGLNSDASVKLNKGDARPIITQSDRAALLAGLACVDVVVIFDELTPENLIRHVEPDILVKGSDYTPDQIAGADFVLSRGGQVVTLPLVPGLSTTSILAKSRDH